MYKQNSISFVSRLVMTTMKGQAMLKRKQNDNIAVNPRFLITC